MHHDTENGSMLKRKRKSTLVSASAQTSCLTRGEELKATGQG